MCTDADYIKSVIEDDPEMKNRCTDDYSSETVVTPETLLKMGGTWLECHIDGIKRGLAHIKKTSTSTIDFHVLIPRKHRGKNSKKIGFAFIDWINNHKPKCVHKINVKIPTIFRDTIIYALSLGFDKEGFDRKSFMKNGKLLDRVCLGKVIL